MEQYAQIEFKKIEKNDSFVNLINIVVDTCFKQENLENTNMYLNVILTNPDNIRIANKKFRKIDKETDVLSFPMFEKDEIKEIIKKSKTKKPEISEVLGDIIISIPRVKEQAIEYGHSTQRELSYMVVHGFYHIVGYDHIKEEDKKIMRKKEEVILNKLNITRENA